ncbi:hypothetical protein QJQ45_019275 [Haematococcus lacustris]|nr:hypothetical protein QJQ45_019275 [Haematococcus lacustris]
MQLKNSLISSQSAERHGQPEPKRRQAADAVFDVLDSCGINVVMMSQGASKTNISLVVEGADGQKAVLALHKRFFEDSSHPNAERCSTTQCSQVTHAESGSQATPCSSARAVLPRSQPSLCEGEAAQVAASCTCAAVHEQHSMHDAAAAGCSACVLVHEQQQQQAVVHEQQCMGSSKLSSAWAAAVVDGQQQQAVGVWQCRLLVAAGCRCASVHEQQQLHQAKMHVQQCMSSHRSNRL